MALIRLGIYNYISNVDENNNLIICEVNGEVLNLKIPTGSYELSQIIDVIHEQLESRYPNAFEILANESTFKCIVRINNPDTRVYFENTHSLKDLLGFEEKFVEGVDENIEYSKS